MSSQENGGLDPDEARLQWDGLVADPRSICDWGGPTAKLRRRVAVRVRDEVRLRDLQEKSQSMRAVSKPIKAPSAEDLEQLSGRVAGEATMNFATDESMWDDALNLAKVQGTS